MASWQSVVDKQVPSQVYACLLYLYAHSSFIFALSLNKLLLLSMENDEEDNVPQLLAKALPGMRSLNKFLIELHLPVDAQCALNMAKLESPALRTLLEETFIKCNAPPAPVRVAFSQGIPRMRELVYLAITMHLEDSRFRNSRTVNVLCLGYRRPRGSSNEAARVHTLENHYPNSLIGYLLRDEWEELLSLVGKDVVIYLLMNATIVVKAKGGQEKRGGWLQIVGIPISETFDKGTIRKKLKIAQIKRHCMLYGMPSIKLGECGLPFCHVLNKTYSSTKIIRLVERIFYHDIPLSKNATRGTTWLYLMSFVKKLLHQHRRCPYSRLYEYHCRDISIPILSKQGLHDNFEMSVWKYVLGIHQPFGFIKAILQRLLHSPCNTHTSHIFRKILGKVKVFLQLRQHETFSMVNLMNGISVKAVASLILGFPKNHLSSQLLDNIVRNFIFWLFDGLVIPLIKVPTVFFRHLLFRVIST